MCKKKIKKNCNFLICTICQTVTLSVYGTTNSAPHILSEIFYANSLENDPNIERLKH